MCTARDNLWLYRLASNPDQRWLHPPLRRGRQRTQNVTEQRHGVSPRSDCGCCVKLSSLCLLYRIRGMRSAEATRARTPNASSPIRRFSPASRLANRERMLASPTELKIAPPRRMNCMFYHPTSWTLNRRGGSLARAAGRVAGGFETNGREPARHLPQRQLAPCL